MALNIRNDELDSLQLLAEAAAPPPVVEIATTPPVDPLLARGAERLRGGVAGPNAWDPWKARARMEEDRLAKETAARIETDPIDLALSKANGGDQAWNARAQQMRQQAVGAAVTDAVAPSKTAGLGDPLAELSRAERTAESLPGRVDKAADKARDTMEAVDYFTMSAANAEAEIAKRQNLEVLAAGQRLQANMDKSEMEIAEARSNMEATVKSVATLQRTGLTLDEQAHYDSIIQSKYTTPEQKQRANKAIDKARENALGGGDNSGLYILAAVLGGVLKNGSAVSAVIAAMANQRSQKVQAQMAGKRDILEGQKAAYEIYLKSLGSYQASQAATYAASVSAIKDQYEMALKELAPEEAAKANAITALTFEKEQTSAMQAAQTVAVKEKTEAIKKRAEYMQEDIKKGANMNEAMYSAEHRQKFGWSISTGMKPSDDDLKIVKGIAGKGDAVVKAIKQLREYTQVLGKVGAPTFERMGLVKEANSVAKRLQQLMNQASGGGAFDAGVERVYNVAIPTLSSWTNLFNEQVYTSLIRDVTEAAQANARAHYGEIAFE